MKHTFKKRIACFVLCLVLITSMLCSTVLSVSASKDPMDEEEQAFVDWEISKSGDALSDGERTLVSVEPFPFGIYHDPDTVYVFADEVELPDSLVMSIRGTLSVDEDEENTSYVYAPSPKSDLVWIHFEGTVCYYATTDMIAKLSKYISGESADFCLQKRDSIAPFSIQNLQALLKEAASFSADHLTVNVSSLESVPCTEILMRDKTGTLSCVFGAIYYVGDRYYFVNYSSLDNSYFDADGNFSYRQGTVTVTWLSSQSQALVTEAEAAMVPATVKYSYEDPTMYGPTESPATFWAFLIFVGFLIPLPLLIIGLVLPHSSKRGYPKYWYRLAICSGVWLALSIAITVILAILQS